MDYSGWGGHMLRKALGGLIAAVLAVSCVEVRADESAAASDVAAGVRQVEAGELSEAVATLDQAVRRLRTDDGPPTDLWLAHAYLGAAYLGLAQREKAKQSFLEACRIDR